MSPSKKTPTVRSVFGAESVNLPVRHMRFLTDLAGKNETVIGLEFVDMGRKKRYNASKIDLFIIFYNMEREWYANREEKFEV